MSVSLKRKRIGGPKLPRKKTVNSKTKPAATRTVRGDQLKWKAIPVTARLEDAEGFYGLEELSDVEVVRDDDGKSTLFKTHVDHVDLGSQTEDESHANRDEDEEWTGFGDTDNNEVAASETSSGLSNAALPSNNPVNGNSGLEVESRFDVLLDAPTEENTDMSAWSSLGISSQMLSALSRVGFAKPTEIQRVAIPPALDGKDVIGKAVTGSGKTLAFAIPMIETWLGDNGASTDSPVGLVIAPTRELAHQITKHMEAICQGLESSPRLATVTGGLSVQKQQRQLTNADIIIGTPGRLWEVFSGSSELLDRLKRVKFLVADEADRLLSDGHFQEVEDILDAIERKVVQDDDAEDDAKDSDDKPSYRQTLVFSATFHKDLQRNLASRKKKVSRAANNLLDDKQSLEYLMHKMPFQENVKPTFVDANPDSQMAMNLSESVLECKAMQKDLYLYTYLLTNQHQRRNLRGPEAVARILVFVNSVSAVKRLVPILQGLNLQGTSIVPLHSNMPQKSRLRSLERFSGTSETTKSASTSILIATDVAARGLDIKGITTIIHYHVPRAADTYVHRSGRTARVDKHGQSILMCSPDETASVMKLIAKVHVQVKPGAELNRQLDRLYLSTDLVQQVRHRIELAQKIVDSNRSTEKVGSEDSWLRKAAADLGVDYDSEEFEQAGKQVRRGRGGGNERKQKQDAASEKLQSNLALWKSQLKADLQKRLDFGDGAGRNGKYLAGGAVDVDKLLAERSAGK